MMAGPGSGPSASARTRDWARLIEQALAFKPRFVTVTDPAARAEVEGPLRGSGVELLAGRDGIARMVSDPSTDRVLTAIVGAAGLEGTWAALEAGKTVALANKETLVVAGPLVMDLARRRGRRSSRSTASTRRSSRRWPAAARRKSAG